MKHVDNPWYDPRNETPNYKPSPRFEIPDDPTEVYENFEFYQRECDCIVIDTSTGEVVTLTVTVAGARRLLKLPTTLEEAERFIQENS